MWQEIVNTFAFIGVVATVGAIVFGWQQLKRAGSSARRTTSRQADETKQVKDPLADIGFEAANPPPRH